jgi:hypothetical protein
VPDVRSNNGDWFVYTTDPKVLERAPRGRSTSTAGKLFRVDERDGRIESWVYGRSTSWRSTRRGASWPRSTRAWADRGSRRPTWRSCASASAS